MLSENLARLVDPLPRLPFPEEPQPRTGIIYELAVDTYKWLQLLELPAPRLLLLETLIKFLCNTTFVTIGTYALVTLSRFLNRWQENGARAASTALLQDLAFPVTDYSLVTWVFALTSLWVSYLVIAGVVLANYHNLMAYCLVWALWCYAGYPFSRTHGSKLVWIWSISLVVAVLVFRGWIDELIVRAHVALLSKGLDSPAWLLAMARDVAEEFIGGSEKFMHRKISGEQASKSFINWD
ncbi:hypothetical protein F5B20DRAFT_585933 [Whalleya microplaca]|nr:hypothetical protein F5B20DRAFT_585933 [Whalleya microplaca]